MTNFARDADALMAAYRLTHDEHYATAAVRLATVHVHPRVFSQTSNLPGPMWLTFLASLTAIALLWVTLVKFEMTAKNTSAQLSRLRRALNREGAPAGRIAPGVATRPNQ